MKPSLKACILEEFHLAHIVHFSIAGPNPNFLWAYLIVYQAKFVDSDAILKTDFC